MEYNSAVSDANKFVTPAEVDGLINAAYRELYGYLARYSLHRIETVTPITATGAATYNLPADMFAILGVYRDETSGRSYFLQRHDHRQRQNINVKGKGRTYRVKGGATNTIEFIPVPQSGTYTVIYVPKPALLTVDGDTFDDVLGYEEYIIADVTIKLKSKEGTKDEEMVRERERVLRRIQDEARDKELSTSVAVQDVNFGRGQYAVPGSFDEYSPDYWWSW
jgi:hypothetical protein